MNVTYDSRNRVVRRTSPNGTLNLTYSGWNLIEERNGRGELQQTYLHGAGVDELLVKVSSSGPAYYHHDGLGSTIALTGENGELLESYRYDAFGWVSVMNASGSALPASPRGNRFLFTGREWLGQAGIYDYRNRVYSAQIGRFLQNDPIQFEAGDVNLYRYVGNGPVNWVDPLGLITIAIPGAGPTGPGWANHDFTQGVQYRHSDTQIFGRHQRAQQRALDAISAARANNPCEVVNIYGYSRGGVGALELAERLNQAGIPVDNLILIDPVTVTGNGGGLVVPSNVSNAESHYQRGPREGFTDFPGTPLNPGPGRSNTQYSGPHANMPRQYFER